MAKGRRRKEEEKKKKWILLLLLLLLFIIVVVIGFNFNKWFPNINANATISGVPGEEQDIDENAGDYQKVDNNGGKNVILPGWGELKIKANTTNITSGIDFFNPKENDGLYYLKFQLKLDGEVLYESGLVAPNKHIQKITLKRALNEGEYDAEVFIQPYKWDKQTPTNNGTVNIKLIVTK